MADEGVGLVAGQNVPVPAGTLSVRVSAAPGAAAYGCALRTDPKTSTILDVVGRGSSTGVNGALSMVRATPTETTFDIDPASLDPDVARIVFCASGSSRDGSQEELAPRSIQLAGGGGAVASFGGGVGRSGPATFLGELYRRGAQWKFRALGQEFKTFADFASFIGRSEEELRSAGSAAATEPAPVSSVAGPLRLKRPPRPPRSVEAPQSASAPRPSPKTPVTEGRAAPTRSAGGPAVVPAAPAQFTLHGWHLTSHGVVDGDDAGSGGRRPVERELLDVRSDGEGRLWPAAFAYQPQDGSRLAPAPPTVLTNGRRIGTAGLPEMDDAKGVDTADGRDEEDTPVGARVFASGGNPPRLVAIDARDGRAWWKAPISEAWESLGRFPSCDSLPDHSIGAVGTPAGVFHAAGSCLVRLLADQACEVETVDLGGQALGSPFALGESVVVPVSTTSGLSLVVRTPDGNISTLRVEGAPDDVDHFGAPVGELGAGRCYWIASQGLLAFEQSEDGAGSRWCPWPTGAEGLPFLSPYRARNGRLWAFCVRTSKGGAVREAALACSISYAGRSEVRELPGPFVSVGAQTFRGRERHRDPWSNAEEEINVGLDYAGRWMMPLARIGERETIVGLVADASSGGGTVRDFVFREGPPIRREVALALHADHGGLRMLHRTFEIESADDLDIYRDGNRLCVHHSESNTCASWPLRF